MNAKSLAKAAIRIAAQVSPRPLKGRARYGFVPGVRWLGAEKESKTITGAQRIHDAWTAKRRVPTTPCPAHPSFLREEEHSLPGSAAAVLPHGRVLGREGLVFDHEGYIVAEPGRRIAALPYDWSERYHFIRPPVIFFPGTWGALTGCGCGGYFHWMLDVLPRMALIRKVAPNTRQWLVGALDKPFVRQSLELLGIPLESCREVNNGQHIQVDELVVASCPSLSGNPPLWAVEFLRTMKPNGFAGAESLSRRLVVSRKASEVRSLIGESELMERLSPMGFVKVVLEDLPLLRQIQLFSQAECIVAPHGAGLTNLVFCEPETKVFEVFGNDYVNVCYWALAEITKLDYSYHIASAAEFRPSGGNSADIILQPCDIEIIESWAENAIRHHSVI